jgi:hypothetical protein
MDEAQDRLSANTRREFFSMAANLQAAPITDRTADFTALFEGRLRLPGPLGKLSQSYQNAKPFPFIVLDDLFEPHLLEPLPAEITQLKDYEWLRIENESLQQVDRSCICSRRSREYGSSCPTLIFKVRATRRCSVEISSRFIPTGASRMKPDCGGASR